MFGIKVEIGRYLDDHQPGWVECQFVDAQGYGWSFVEKVPVVSMEDLDRNSTYPRPGRIACQVIGKRYVGGKEVVTIDTAKPWGIESTTGQTYFDVVSEQLIELD